MLRADADAAMADAPSSLPTTTAQLPVDAVARCTRVRLFLSEIPQLQTHNCCQEAQKDGIFAGLSSGLVGGLSRTPRCHAPSADPPLRLSSYHRPTLLPLRQKQDDPLWCWCVVAPLLRRPVRLTPIHSSPPMRNANTNDPRRANLFLAQSPESSWAISSPRYS